MGSLQSLPSYRRARLAQAILGCLLVVGTVAQTGCGNDLPRQSASKDETIVVSKGNLTVVASMGQLRNVDMELRKASDNSLIQTLPMDDADSVTFSDIPLDVGIVVVSAKPRATSTYYDTASKRFVPLTTTLHAAYQMTATSSIALTPLTEAAYQRALSLTPTLTQSSILSANSSIGSIVGVDITQPPTVINEDADLGKLGFVARDAYAVAMAAMANIASKTLPNETAPMEKFLAAFAVDTTDGDVDGQAIPGRTGLPLLLPYPINNFSTALTTEIKALLTAKGQDLSIADLVNPTAVAPNGGLSVTGATGLSAFVFDSANFYEVNNGAEWLYSYADSQRKLRLDVYYVKSSKTVRYVKLSRTDGTTPASYDCAASGATSTAGCLLLPPASSTATPAPRTTVDSAGQTITFNQTQLGVGDTVLYINGVLRITTMGTALPSPVSQNYTNLQLSTFANRLNVVDGVTQGTWEYTDSTAINTPAIMKVQIATANRRVTSMTVVLGTTSAFEFNYQCNPARAALAADCSGMSVSPDYKSITLSNTLVKAVDSDQNVLSKTLTLSGTFTLAPPVPAGS